MGSQCVNSSILQHPKRRNASWGLQSLESKKLEEAGYHYANGGNSQNTQSLEDSAAAWGIAIEIPDEQEEEEFIVFYDAALALEVISIIKDQWIMSMGGAVALNYATVLEVIKLKGIKKDRKILNLLHEIRCFETGYLKAVNEKRDKK